MTDEEAIREWGGQRMRELARIIQRLRESGKPSPQIADAILSSDWLDRVKREAAEKAWDEGVNAKANSSSIFTADVLARNPYREATA